MELGRSRDMVRGLKMLDTLKQKLLDYLLMIIIVAILLYGKVFPGSEVNTPSSRESIPH